LEIKKTEMTKKTSRIGLTSSMDSFIRLMLSTLAPRQPPIPFPFLSPVSRLSSRQQISVRRKPA
jgi:hypothetical protein